MDSSEVFSVLIYLVVGMITGIVNTLAGGGSIMVFSLLILTGMPPTLANGTNCVGILIQNFTGTITFLRAKLLDLHEAAKYAVPAVLGGLLGGILVGKLPDETQKMVVGYIMVALLFLTVRKSRRKAGNQPKELPVFWRFLVFATVGFAGGFVQAGLGLIVLVVLNQFTPLSLIRVNAVKMAILLIFTVPIFIIFSINGQIDWLIAIWLAVGQVGGTWLTGRLIKDSYRANTIINQLLIVLIFASILQMFGFFGWAWALISGFCC